VDASGRWYGAPITTVLAGVVLSNARSELFWRTGICRVLHFERGRCDLGAGDVVMTDRGARQIGASVGATIDAFAKGRSGPLRLRVTGLISTPDVDLPYWWGDGPGDFPFGHSSGGPGGPAETDPLIASQATALAVPAQDVPTAIGQVPLRAGAVGLADEAAVKQVLSRTAATLNRQGITAGTQLPSVLAAADRQRRAMTTIVAIAATQLVLLAVWVLGDLLVRSSDARRSEARVAALRGFPAISMVWATAAEPGILCALGAVLGVAAAWVSVVVARAHLLVPSAVIAFDGRTCAALGLTVAAIIGALGIATMRLLGAGDRERAVRAPTGPSVMGRVADAVLVVLAIAALVVLDTTGALSSAHSDPLASAAPGLIALGAAVLAVQLILSACRLGMSPTADSGWVGLFLALRQTVRRPTVLRQARVLIIALCLACFASVAWSVARSNRATAAQFQVGARAVVTVAPLSSTSLERAVERADPRGRFAMATVDLHTPSTRLLAVDARRLPAAASWPTGISAATVQSIARTLRPSGLAAVTLPGERVQVAARTVTTVTRVPVDLDIWVFTAAAGTAIVDLGSLHPGQGTYRADLARVCPAGCELAGLGVGPAPGRGVPAAGTVELSIGRVVALSPAGTSRQVPADLVPDGWRSTAPGVRVESGQAQGLTLTATAAAIGADAGATGSLTSPMVSPADHPLVLPGVATSELESANAEVVGPLPAEGLDGNPISVHPVVVASALPRVGADAVMVDLGLLSDAQVAPTSPDTTDEVWLGPRAPADALARLRAAGLTLISVQRSSTVWAALQRSAPALADDFLLAATIAALIVAAASTLGALGAATRERATELVSLQVAGVPRSVLVRSLGIESAILMLTAMCGVGVGALAAVIAAPSLPELASASLAPLRYGLPASVIAAILAAVVIAVSLVAGAVTAVLVRRMSPALLRIAADEGTG
jgi:hypothetical protein